MFLKSIKLAGFKSFADATTIPVKLHINAIVGPNGCGKSNIIDAVRWVIGETSAKKLRGQSMSDVIFNGTTLRKPVGKAAIELLFDNTDNRVTGEFGKFSEIAIRREVHREGQSSYFINGTVCRRRDVADLFRGTGLGSRGYAIIEQGVISQIIEAKPEDMRNHLEEVAGIALYKSRRRETESRMKRTQENLDRLLDLCNEVEKQLNHLQRQANAAERYKVLKTEERLLSAQTKALHWQHLQDKLEVTNALLSEQETRREEVISEQRHAETAIERHKVKQGEITFKQNEVQKQFYSLAADIARLEQRINHTQEQSQRWQQELDECGVSWEELNASCAEHYEQIDALTNEIENLKPQSSSVDDKVLTADHALQTAEQLKREAEREWELHQQAASRHTQNIEVARTNLQHYQDQLDRLRARISKLNENEHQKAIDALQEEVGQLELSVNQLTNELENLERKNNEIASNINQQRDINTDLSKQLNVARDSLQEKQSEKLSLEAIQKAALVTDDETINAWLDQHALTEKPRLGQSLRVTNGWEYAVEAVMQGSFDAVCVDDIEAFLNTAETLPEGHLHLISKQSHTATTNFTKSVLLEHYVDCDWPAASLLTGIYAADNLNDAIALSKQLGNNESVITKEGVWLGNNWLRVTKANDDQDNVILREQRINALSLEVAEQKAIVEQLQNKLKSGEECLLALEKSRDDLHPIFQEKNQSFSQKQSEYRVKESQLVELKQQQKNTLIEIGECETQCEEINIQMATTDEQFKHETKALEELNAQSDELLKQRDEARESFEEARTTTHKAQQFADELGIRLSSSESQLAILKQAVSHSEKQLEKLADRRELLEKRLGESDEPLRQLEKELQDQLDKRVVFEDELREIEEVLRNVVTALEESELQRETHQNDLAQMQSDAEKIRMEHQALSVRQTTIKEQLEEANIDLNEVVAEIPAEANLDEWNRKSESVERKISRLGPINLAAIEEYKSLSERKEYLDKQHKDLEEALSILLGAIKKIDKETKTKFKETFEIVNSYFKQLFPKIFSGGQACLELEEDDLLTAGIVVKAQPPGKRNTTIHMLSGGEKALTAIALVFSLFQINPAPFCILDEVDAPLDDVNVGRFCQLVKEMSEKTQFLVISHNKVTIEKANNLMGITMQEPGVSRLVAVDMEEAIAMVE